MKKILILVLLINCCLSAFCESMREVGGNKVVANKSTISIDGLNTKRSFYVKVDEEGSYYLNLFILGGKSVSGILKEYPIMINGVCVDTIVSKKPSWHSFNSSKPYMFKRGDNIVEIFDSAPHVANVDNIFLTQHQIINSEDSVKYTELKNTFVPVVDSITDTYNCFAWSVGIWDHWEDPTDDFYTDCILGGQRYPEELYYDDFYMSNGYLRCDLKDAVIFLWGNKDGKDSTFLHASTSRYSNNDNIPHGYDLESKMGSLERIYHTYDHINGYGYGKLLTYYKPGTLFKNKSLYEKVADGEVMMRNYVVEDDKRSFIKEKVSSIENDKLNVFNKLFVNWKNDIKNSIYSTFKQLRTLESYKPLRDFVSNDSILRYAIMELIANNEQFAIPLLEDEILPYNRDAYNEVSLKLKDVKNRTVKTKFYSSPISNAKLFVNCILENKIFRSPNFGNENIVTPPNRKSDINMRVSCNGNTCVINVDVESKYPTTCCIYTLNGQLVANLAQEAKLSTGTHVFTHLSNKKGTYLVYFENGNTINIKKIIIK